jgi:threonine dehydratase
MIAAFPTVADFRAAHELVREHAYHTPLLTSRSLGLEAGCRAYVKAESLQRTGS